MNIMNGCTQIVFVGLPTSLISFQDEYHYVVRPVLSFPYLQLNKTVRMSAHTPIR